MPQKTIKAKIYRFNPPVEEEPRYETYEVPLESGMSVRDILDYIYENLDSSLAYYGHAACHDGVCGRCTLVINGKASLACQTAVSGDITVEPPPKFKVIRDLAYVIKGGS